MNHSYDDFTLQTAIDATLRKQPFTYLSLDNLGSTWEHQMQARLGIIKSALQSLPEPVPVTMNFTPFTGDELAAIRGLMHSQDLDATQVLRQALRHYQQAVHGSLEVTPQANPVEDMALGGQMYWRDLAHQIAHVWWKCHSIGASLQHGDIDTDVSFSVVCEQHGGQCFHADTPEEAWHKAEKWLMSPDRASFPPELTPAVAADGWISWPGGPCPVRPDTFVEVMFRRRSETSGRNIEGRGVASYYSLTPDQWSHDNDPGDIVAYRIAKGEH